MPERMPVPQRIAIITHPSLPDSLPLCAEIAEYLRARTGNSIRQGSYTEPAIREAVAGGGIDLLLALGGDGTMLRTAHVAVNGNVPVLGINLGRFGFLMEIHRQEWKDSLDLLLEGKYWLEERMILAAEHWRGEDCLGCWDVINEVVVTRGAFVRPVRLEARVDGYRLASYVADGLIAATPTGSTAYALAAGGPIMPPTLRNIVIVPVAPHLSVDQAVILSEGASVQITVFTDHEAVFSVDGQPAVAMHDRDAVRVAANRKPVRFVRFQDPGYFYRNLMMYMEQNPSAGDLK